MGLKSHQTLNDISSIVDWSFGCKMFVERYAIREKENFVYKVYTTEVGFSFNNFII